MKKLELSFFDTSETVTVDETSLLIVLDNKTTPEGLTACYSLEVDEELPNKLLRRPLMFYVYDDLPILQLYRSAYISAFEWREESDISSH